MPIVHEVFGYRVTDNSAAAKNSRRNANCPFMEKRCDGGGNRGQSQISLRTDASLRSYFAGVGNEVACGICSIEHQEQEWVICPRRILCFGNSKEQDAALRSVLSLANSLNGWKSAKKFAVWSEARVNAENAGNRFQYTFDYIVRPLSATGKPQGSPLIVEIMTCSTSGGNKKKGTDIQTAFCKAIRGEEHQSPNVNLRQVWARMASQLIVKSAAAMQWEGCAIWVVQDSLANYIDKTTGLRLSEMRQKTLDEVNLLAFRYNENDQAQGARRIEKATLYAGPISSNGNGKPCFLDIIKPAFIPDFGEMENSLNRRNYRTLEIS